GRRRMVGGPVLGVQPRRKGVQRRLAGVRSGRYHTAVEDRFQPGHRGTGGGTMMARARRLSAAGLTLGLLTASSSAAAQTVAITGATIYPVSGPKLEHGTIVVVDGKITAVGTNVSIPSGITRIDATGRWITPGFVQT